MIRQLLGRMAKYKAILGEEYASTAYTRAVSIVTSQKILDDIVIGERLPKGIGKGIQSFIAEAVATGSVVEMLEMQRDPRVCAVETLERIIGVGPVTAMKWVSEGTMTIADAAIREDLTTSQRIGILVDGKVLHRVSRGLVEKVFNEVKALLPSGTDATVTGSYRRGSMTSGDVDILIVSDSLVARSLPRDPQSLVINSGEMKTSYLVPVSTTIPNHSEMYVQVDIFIAPTKSRVAYLAYSTGSAAHNVYLRGLAKSKGYHLSQYALTDPAGKEVPLEKEEDLYSALGIAYVPPEKR